MPGNTTFTGIGATDSLAETVFTALGVGSGNGTVLATAGSTSLLNDLRANIFYSRSNTGYYSDPESTSIFNALRADKFYDRSDTNYFTEPANISYVKYLGRRAHNTGHFVGTYNNIGDNSAQSNPIYSIGSSYNPSTTSLSNFYGVGYSHTNASFISFTGASGWGMYVASDGDARVYISGENGTVSSKGAMYAPTYYDSNNTGYYIHPDSTSVLSEIYINSRIRHNGDTNTYMEFHTNDQWRVVAGGSEILEVTTSQIYMTRELRCTQDVIAFYSDERLKEKLGKIESPLDKISKLEAFYYVNNDLAKEKGFDDDKKQIGLSAQQVKEVMPEVVHSAPFDTDFTEDGEMFSTSGEDYLTLKYDRLVPLLVEGIKEQTEIVKSQQKEIDELKEMVKLLLNK